MVKDTDIKNANQSVGNGQEILANFLVSALDMEDSVTRSIYKDYMDEKNWPKNLRPDVFKNIREYLSILIEDTEKHRNIILGLMQKYGEEKQPE